MLIFFIFDIASITRSAVAYGQSPDASSPNHADQAELFAKGQLKTVRFTESDIQKGAIRSYKPGE